MYVVIDLVPPKVCKLQGDKNRSHYFQADVTLYEVTEMHLAYNGFVAMLAVLIAWW